MSQVIALVDDDRNILTSVSIALQSEGFVTRVYTDPTVALKAIGENPPDLAVLDIKMPQMDGMELLRRIREHSAVPVIFLTSKDDERPILGEQSLAAAHGMLDQRRGRQVPEDFGAGGDTLGVKAATRNAVVH